jgi:hypothetical protein
MTRRKAERLTGYEIRSLDCGESGRFCFGAYEGEELVLEADHADERWALRCLVRAVYMQHSYQVLERYGWHRSRCHAAKPLQIHHRKYRSHGGTNQPDNLEPVCVA